MLGRIHSMESFGTVDGPGIRFVLFLQGCPLRCLYCHNPDTWRTDSGIKMTSDEVVSQVMKYKSYIKKGGITISGGEPLLQIDFVIDVFSKLKALGVHTALDTSGLLFNEQTKLSYDRLLEVCDLVLLDLKHIDSQKHIKLTGHKNETILKFATYLSENRKPVWIRHVLVPGYTDDVKDLIALRKFIDTLTNVEKIEVLPYHMMGVVKYEQLGIQYPLDGVLPPTKASIDLANKILVKNEEVCFD